MHGLLVCFAFLYVSNRCFVHQVNEVLSEVSLIKDRQEDLDGKLDTMKNENEALWREVGFLKTPQQFLTLVISKPGVEPPSKAHPAAEDCEQADPIPCGTCSTEDGRCWNVSITITMLINSILRCDEAPLCLRSRSPACD